MSTLESLSVEVFFEIFTYLSAADVLQSFSSLNTHFTTILTSQYLWHIHIGGGHMSFSMFADYCQHVLGVVSARVASLRVILSRTIGGWSLVASAMRMHQVTMLRRLHLLDITSHEFKNLLRSPLLKQLRTLLIDLTQDKPFRKQIIEGAYLSEVRNLDRFSNSS